MLPLRYIFNHRALAQKVTKNIPSCTFSTSTSRNQLKENATAREELSTALQGLAWYGLQDGIYNHCSTLARSKSGNGEVVLLPPFGPLWHDITPESLVGVDPISGEKVEGDLDLIEPGKLVHLAVYQRRPDVKAIMHVHSPYGNVLSSLKDYRLKMVNQLSCRFYEDVAYDKFRLFTNEGENNREQMALCLGTSKHVAMLLNHGIFTVGPSVAMAFDAMYGMEMACKNQVKTMSTGGEMLELSHEAALSIRKDFEAILPVDSQKHLDALKHHFEKHAKN